MSQNSVKIKHFEVRHSLTTHNCSGSSISRLETQPVHFMFCLILGSMLGYYCTSKGRPNPKVHPSPSWTTLYH